MSWIDYVIFGIVIFSTMVSLIRGLLREVLSLITFACAVLISGNYYKTIAIYFTKFEEQIVRNSIAITLLFIATLLIGQIVNSIVSSLVELTGLSCIDRVLGICFGLLRGILIVSAVLWFLNTFTSFPHSQDWQQSQLIPEFRGIIKLFLRSLQKTSSFV
ncbi:colicin V production protein [Candidatus Palibaumannia cicadellinicola]|uniref:Colicin V production protein n=1 Tax=Candidatus Palibaumannia cicadellinicola TaxID=186490 RepID=A0A2N4XXL8_9GAMM|nr:CvpA family protein [Candidatus Baumannia cicadellinicola]PLK59207.1 colicin V production protein [Candidatus Baumannia cicadellinicola]